MPRTSSSSSSSSNPPPQISIYPNSGGSIAALTPSDVLSGRGVRVTSHPGNMHFRAFVEEYKDEYNDPSTKRHEKAHVAARLVAEVRRGGGRFLKESGSKKDGTGGGGFVEIGDEKAWIKATTCLRDAVPPRKKKKKKKKKETKKKKQSPSGKNTNDDQPTATIDARRKSSDGGSTSNKSSPAVTKSSSTRNSPAVSSHNERGRLVIVRPKDSVNTDESDRNGLRHQEHQQLVGQWPFYKQHCERYGFAVEVEHHLMTYQIKRKQPQPHSQNSEDGPYTRLLLVKENDDSNKGKGSVPLQCILERLIIRSYSSTNKVDGSSNNLHPDLKEGDIVQTLDGQPNPTFAMLYEMMHGNEKLVLEVVARNNDVVGNTEAGNGRENDSVGSAHDGISNNSNSASRSGKNGSDRSSASRGSDAENANDDRLDAVIAWNGASSTGNTYTQNPTNKISETVSSSKGSIEPEEDLLPKAKKPSRWGPKSGSGDTPVSSQMESSLVLSQISGADQQQPRATTALIASKGSASSENKASSHIPKSANASFGDTASSSSSSSSSSSPGMELLQLMTQNRRARSDSNPYKETADHYQYNQPVTSSSSLNTQQTMLPRCKPHTTGEGKSIRKRQRRESVDRDNDINNFPEEAALFDMVEEQLKLPANSNVGVRHSPAGKVLNVSSLSSSPANVDCAVENVVKDEDDVISLSSDSSSTSSDSSDSSTSSDSDFSARAQKKQCKQTAPLQKQSSGQSSMTHQYHQPASFNPVSSNIIGASGVETSVSPYHIVASEQQPQALFSASRKRSPSIASNGSVSNYKPLQATSSYTSGFAGRIKQPPVVVQAPIHAPRKRSSSLSLPSNDNNLIEAPTSLSRLWPDPSDVIKAVTRWTPPVVTVRRHSHDRQSVHFIGPIGYSHHHSNNENGPEQHDNPLLQQRIASDANNSGRGREEGMNGRGNSVPREFKNADEVMETMAHPLMMEGLHSINGDYHAEKCGNGRWSRDSYHLKMTKLTEVCPIFKTKSYFRGNIKMYEAQFSAHGETNLPPSNLSELYCIYFQEWNGCKFGIVAHDFPTTISFRKYSEGKAFLKLWLVVHENEQETEKTGWLSRNDFKKLLDQHKNGLNVKPSAVFTLISCGSTTNIVRQFEAIKCLPYLKPHLQRALFTSHIATDNNNASKIALSSNKPRSLPKDIWRSLAKNHNTYQLSSISQVLTGSCRDNICLLHGPPGTGKSSTIVGLVTALLSGKAPLPGGRQSGCLIHPGKSIGATILEQKARNRILVCAATNQAVDSLAWKIKRGSIGPSGKVGDFPMARFGSLPWELSRETASTTSVQKRPKNLSEMEDFLYEINVDRRASDGMQDFSYDDNEDGHEEIKSWSSPDRQKPKRKKRRKIIGRSKLRSDILSGCNVVVTTLSGAGSKAFIDAVCRDPTRNDSEFDAVIIDEACQASEPESLIPFKYNPTTMALVGDPKQLPVLTLSKSSAHNKLFERSLFERLQTLNFPTILLRTQYRMCKDIADFPSQEFYDGKLITPNSINERPQPPWYSCPCFPPVCFWDIYGGKGMTTGDMGHGLSNKEEADFIISVILSTLAHTFLMKRSDADITVGIISFYRDQVKLLKDLLAQIPALANNPRLNVKVATVDGFQGQECDIIILSCVRSNSRSKRGGGQRGGTVGFLSDQRRVNVALTRAKSSLWIVGNSEVLKGAILWRTLIKHMDERRVMRRGGKFRDLYSKWMASNE